MQIFISLKYIFFLKFQKEGNLFFMIVLHLATIPACNMSDTSVSK